ncbi:MAG: replication-associated recombination protein A [Thermodesulfobacteriota bacterium]|nr:replication-associated recombination protein A [Thermodesulfobacteriota bacterium]
MKMQRKELFSKTTRQDNQIVNPPLADRMRPNNLNEFLGQHHVLGEGKPLRIAIEKGEMNSCILWGPPGVGKTTIVHIIAQMIDANFITFSAVLSGIKEVKDEMKNAEHLLKLRNQKTIIFIDEIHRFNKAQQDALLPYVEKGIIILIGATTENPSFEIIKALLSRCQVFPLYPLSHKEIHHLLTRAIQDKERGYGKYHVTMEDGVEDHIINMAHGDARVALNILQFLVEAIQKDKPVRFISKKMVEDATVKKVLQYDKDGEEHYNLISALHKSMRGGDPDAALYWLCRMLLAGEDPLYIARRVVRFASEDVGNADPFGLILATSAMEAYKFLGSPEGELAIAHAIVYLASAPKSNAIYKAYNEVIEDVQKTGSLPVPLHIRNAPTSLMKAMGYGDGYKYPHSYPDHFVEDEYLPPTLKNKIYYRPEKIGAESKIKARLEKWWKKRKT